MYVIKDGYYGNLVLNKKTNTETFESFGKAVYLEKVFQMLESEDIKLELRYDYLGKACTWIMPRADLNRSNMSTLRAKGIDAFEHTAIALIETIRQQETGKNLEYLHKTIGWREIQTAIGTKVIFLTGTVNQTKYKYDGTLNLSKAGTLEGWLEVITRLIIGHTPLEVAMIIGFSAVVQGYVAPDVGEQTLYVHVYGDSSKGKTTGLRIGLSTAGAPFKITGTEGLFYTWNATQNALLQPLSYNFGFPLLYDEASEYKGDISPIIYFFSEGRIKGRLNQNSELKESPSFSTTITSTAEHAILSKSTRNSGLKVRVLEIGNQQWTKSAKHSEDILKGINQNYGHANTVFADYILTIPKKDIIEEWYAWRDVFIQNITKPDAFTDRISAKYATLLLTASLVNGYFQFNIDMDKILEFFVDNENNKGGTRDIALAAYDYLMSEYVANADKFGKRTSRPCLNYKDREIWGFLEYLKKDMTLADGSISNKRLVILPERMKEILHEGGFEEISILLIRWHELGWLDRDRDRPTRDRVVGNISLPCYVIYIVEGDATDNDEAEALLPEHEKPIPVPLLPRHKRPKPRPIEISSYEDVLKLEEAAEAKNIPEDTEEETDGN